MRAIPRKLHKNLLPRHFTPDVTTNQGTSRGLSMKPTPGLEIHQVFESRALGSCLNYKRVVNVSGKTELLVRTRKKKSVLPLAGSHTLFLLLRWKRWSGSF